METQKNYSKCSVKGFLRHLPNALTKNTSHRKAAGIYAIGPGYSFCSCSSAEPQSASPGSCKCKSYICANQQNNRVKQKQD
jgi:hypothetical protein